MSSDGDIPSAPTLKTYGLTRDQSSTFQKLAAIPEREFERRIEAAARDPERMTPTSRRARRAPGRAGGAGALAKLGALLADLPKATGGQPYRAASTCSARERVERPTLAEVLGMESGAARKTAMVAEQLAALPADVPPPS